MTNIPFLELARVGFQVKLDSGQVKKTAKRQETVQ